MMWAQSDEPLRIELESAKDQNDYQFANMQEDGVLVFYPANSPKPDSLTWAFVHYDTNFQKNYHFTIDFPIYTEYISYSKSTNYLYLFFQKRFPKKERVRNFLVTIQLSDHHYNTREIKELQNREVYEIFGIDNEIVIHAGDNKKDSIYFYHNDLDKLYSLGDIFPYRMEFCVPDTFNHRWLVGLTQAKSEDPSGVFLYEYNYLTKKARIQNFQDKTPNKGDHIYNSARATVINADTTLLLGTYNTLQDRYSSNLHSGVYSLLLHGWELDSAHFYNYANLKTKSPDDNKKASSNLNLQVLVGRTASGNNQYALATEVFYPEYDYSYHGYDPYYGYGYFGDAGTTTFIGYQHVNAYITTFDQNGILLWDNYLQFNNLVTKQLYPIVHLSFLENGETLIYYPRNNRILSMLVSGYDILEKISAINIESKSSRDVVEYNVDTEIEPWYGNYFLVSGYQYIRNRDKAIKAKRYVFHLNKLEYR